MVISLISSSTSLTNKVVSISLSVNRILESLIFCIHAYLNLAQLGRTPFLLNPQDLGASPSLVTDCQTCDQVMAFSCHSSYSVLAHTQSLHLYKTMGRG